MARYFENELIEQIKDANDIVSVISEHVALKKKGRNYWGCCPFHNEKTPSFSVTPEKGFYYCFGCGASGNAIRFLMNYEHISFPEALEKLANRANISLPVQELSQEQRAREEHRRTLYEINELAAKFFHNCLIKTQLGKAGLDYLLKRGLTKDTIEKFQLGFAPDSWDKLYSSFIERGYKDSDLIHLGLCRRSDKGKVYDYFRNRVMFPIMDGKGRVVAFGGRVLDDSTPKYLNSPETDIFSKGHILFGFDKAYRSIREKKQAVLVEGYMDVISAHNAGVTNVVASLGTAYTRDHGKLLVRQADEIVLAYDMDGAGQKAAKRAIELLLNTDFKVRIVAMPDGKDPDDYCRNHGGKEFESLVAKAISPFEYLLNDALIRHDSNDAQGKQAILADMFAFISTIHSQVQREDLLRALALPLWLDNSSIFRYFREYLKKGNIEVQTEEVNGSLSTPTSSEEDELMVMSLSDSRGLERTISYVPIEDFTNTVHQHMLTKASQLLTQGQALTSSALEEIFDDQEQQEWSRLMVLSQVSYDERHIDGLIRAVRLKSLREQYKNHSILADQLSRAGDNRFIGELKKCQELTELIKQWS